VEEGGDRGLPVGCKRVEQAAVFSFLQKQKKKYMDAQVVI